MSQQRIDRSGNQNGPVALASIDSNFDDLFDIMQILDADFTFVAKTGFQPMFNASPNGALNLPVGLYEFETLYDIANMSLSSGTWGFALGGSATIESQKWIALARSGTFTTSSATNSTYNTASNPDIGAFATNGLGFAHIRGVFRLSSSGTLIPQISVTTFAGAVPSMKKNSFFRVKKLSQVFTQALIAPPLPVPSPNTPFWS